MVWRFPRTKTTAALWATCTSDQTPSQMLRRDLNVAPSLPCLSVLVASAPVTEHCQTQTGLVVFGPSLQVPVGLEDMHPELSLLQAKQSELSPPLLLGEMLQLLYQSLAALSPVASFLSRSGEPSAKYSKHCPYHAEQRRKITFTLCAWLSNTSIFIENDLSHALQ